MTDSTTDASSTPRDSLAKNVDLYPWYIGLYSAFFWMPIFFLYFSEYLTIAGVLQLEAIYYVVVVAMEVPSGWASDRLGRRPTLIIGASSLFFGYFILFAAGWWMGGVFFAFAAGQALLALGIAMHSGTTTSLHYESLRGLDRADEYDDREALVARVERASTAGAALVGGAVTFWSLSFAYAASALVAAGLLVAAVSFAPTISADSNTSAARGNTVGGPGAHTTAELGFFDQVRQCIGYLENPVLRWLFGFAVTMTVFLHIPYEFYQPYLELLSLELIEGTRWAGVAAGTHMAVATGIGAWAAGYSIEIRDRYGTRATLLGTVIGEVVLIGLLGIYLHPVIAVLLLARSLPSALSKAPLNAAVTPRIPQRHRATYLSVQSLAGRLAFALSLLGLSLIADVRARPGADPTWPALSELLLISTGVGIAAAIVLALTGPPSLDAPDENDRSSR